jgi:hypothetical protein
MKFLYEKLYEKSYETIFFDIILKMIFKKSPFFNLNFLKSLFLKIIFQNNIKKYRFIRFFIQFFIQKFHTIFIDTYYFYLLYKYCNIYNLYFYRYPLFFHTIYNFIRFYFDI